MFYLLSGVIKFGHILVSKVAKFISNFIMASALLLSLSCLGFLCSGVGWGGGAEGAAGRISESVVGGEIMELFRSGLFSHLSF